MKVKDLLEIQGIIDNRIIPSDMNDNKLNEHYSQSKDEFMSILDMDLIHLVRSYSKCLGIGKISNKELLGQQISIIERAVRIIEQQL